MHIYILDPYCIRGICSASFFPFFPITICGQRSSEYVHVRITRDLVAELLWMMGLFPADLQLASSKLTSLLKMLHLQKYIIKLLSKRRCSTVIVFQRVSTRCQLRQKPHRCDSQGAQQLCAPASCWRCCNNTCEKPMKHDLR